MTPELYDELKAIADANGGVGHSRLGIWDGPTSTANMIEPCCIWGMSYMLPDNRLLKAHEELLNSGITPVRQDNVFTATERADPNYRLPFEEWAQRLGVTRG